MAFVQDRIGWMAGLTKGTGFDEWLWVWLFVLYSINTPLFLYVAEATTAHFFYRFGLDYCGSLCIGL